MKNTIKRFLIVALVTIIGFSMTTCDSDSGGGVGVGGGGGKGGKNTFAVDISEQTKWDYMIGSTSGESAFLLTNGSSNLPKEMYLKPNKDSDVGYTILFKDNGLPDKIVHQGNILKFGNFKGYKYDVAVISPNGSTAYHFNIESDINFDNYTKRAVSAQERSVGGDIKDVLLPGNLLEAAALAVDLASCVGAVIPPYVSAVPCIKFLATTVAEVGAVVAFDGMSEEAARMLVQTFKCVDALGIDNLIDLIGTADDCIALLAHMAELLCQVDIQAIEGRFSEVEDASFVINNAQNYDIIVTASWTGKGDIILAVIDPSGYNDGNLQNGTSITHRYWRKGEAQAGTYNVGIRPNWAWGNTLQVKVRIYAFGNIKTYTAEISQGRLDPGGWYKVASFDSNGNIW